MLELFEKAGNVYFRPKKFEADGKIYEKLGIKAFRKLVLINMSLILKLTGMKKHKNGVFNYYLENPTIDKMKRFEMWGTRLNESWHLFAGMQSTMGFIANPSDKVALVATMINLYCVFLQRYNRCRIYKLLEKENTLKVKRNTQRMLRVQKHRGLSDIHPAHPELQHELLGF